MKQIVLIYSILLFSCNQNTKTQNEENYAIELINNDFLKFADSSKVDSLKTQLIKSFDIYDDENFRIAFIDAEELSEFNFNFFLPNLNKILAKRDIKLSVQKLNDKENSYDALMNGDTINLHTEEELNKGIFWDAASRNFFRNLNEILKAKNSNEIFYLLYGGNDLHAILLTQKQHSIIAEYYKNEPKEIPYRP